MMIRGIAIWVVLLAIAIANGAIREAAIVPLVGEAPGHAVSTAILCTAIVIVTRLTIGWMQPASARAAWRLGLLWLALTVAFEFLAGHYLFGNPWSDLLADYDLLRGRLWILVPLTMLVAPVITAARSGKFTAAA